MIVLFTDFDITGPYTGQVLNVLHQRVPDVKVISLFADVPAFNVRAAAYLLPAYIEEFDADTVFLCVVDPGVGSERLPLVVHADDYWFVGPDNGLFDVVCKQAERVERWEITYRPERLSASFHGRDLFAPVAAMLAMSESVPGVRIENAADQWDSVANDLYEVIYLDHYGNAMTGVRAKALNTTRVLRLRGNILPYRRTFSEVGPGESFWYENANGLVEIASREQSTAVTLGLCVGDRVEVIQ